MGKSTAGFVLALIGGILQVLTGLIVIALVVLAAAFTFQEYSNRGAGVVYLILALSYIILGIMSIVSGVKMRSEDFNVVKTWGIVAIVVAVLSLGNLLTLIGGILGIVQSKE